MRETKLERDYQASLIDKLEKMFPDCLILKNDSGYRQGIPDLLVIYGPYYAFLEVKPYESAEHRPNQDWYVEKLNRWSYAAFIFPENEREVLNDLQQALSPRRKTRVSKP